MLAASCCIEGEVQVGFQTLLSAQLFLTESVKLLLC